MAPVAEKLNDRTAVLTPTAHLGQPALVLSRVELAAARVERAVLAAASWQAGCVAVHAPPLTMALAAVLGPALMACLGTVAGLAELP